MIFTNLVLCYSEDSRACVLVGKINSSSMHKPLLSQPTHVSHPSTLSQVNSPAPALYVVNRLLATAVDALQRRHLSAPPISSRLVCAVHRARRARCCSPHQASAAELGRSPEPRPLVPCHIVRVGVLSLLLPPPHIRTRPCIRCSQDDICGNKGVSKVKALYRRVNSRHLGPPDHRHL